MWQRLAGCGYDAQIDPVGSVIWRVVGPVNPALRARLLWARAGENAGKAVIGRHVKHGDTVVDVGANVGTYTDRLARIVGRDGAVYAFEPNRGYHAGLERIAATHGNVHLMPCAVSDHEGTARLSIPALPSGRAVPDMGSLEPRDSASPTDVPVVTLDSAVPDDRRVAFLKCDVEGHEHAVLLGATGMLRRDQPVVFVEIEQRHRARPLGETFELLESLGYDGFAFSADEMRPLTEFDVERDQVGLLDETMVTPAVGYFNDFAFVPRPS